MHSAHNGRRTVSTYDLTHAVKKRTLSPPAHTRRQSRRDVPCAQAGIYPRGRLDANLCDYQKKIEEFDKESSERKASPLCASTRCVGVCDEELGLPRRGIFCAKTPSLEKRVSWCEINHAKTIESESSLEEQFQFHLRSEMSNMHQKKEEDDPWREI